MQKYNLFDFTLDTTLERCAFCLIVTLDTDKARSDLIKPLGITFLLNELVIWNPQFFI